MGASIDRRPCLECCSFSVGSAVRKLFSLRLLRMFHCGDPMRHAALGFRVHSGWTALVAISLDQGFPQVLLRQRPHLVATFTYEFRQPYHTAEKRPASEARSVISHARADARRLAYQTIHSVETSLQERGYEIHCSGLLLASGKQLPALSQILASHALIHTADGELFREALFHAQARAVA